MLNEEGGRVEQGKAEQGVSGPNVDPNLKNSGNERTAVSLQVSGDESLPPLAVSITIQVDEISKPGMSISKNATSAGGDKSPVMTSSKKGFLSRSGSHQEQCRVCQQQTDEALIDLGCSCQGELGKAHRSCIDIWFHTKGSIGARYVCKSSISEEILLYIYIFSILAFTFFLRQIATNVPYPESQPSVNNWIWRINSAFVAGQERGRICFSPLWVAFAILIGGLLLDVLVSVSLGVSVLPVNIIIGVLIVLGLGTSFRLALECCHEWGTRRDLRTADINLNPGYHPAV